MQIVLGRNRKKKWQPSGVQVVWIGDVLRIPFDEERSAVAQVVAHFGGDIWYLAIFEKPWTPGDPRSVKSLTRDRIIFLIPTWDSLVASGDWEVLGREKPVGVHMPTFKIDLLDSERGIDGTYFESFDGKTGRQANADEAAQLSYRSSAEPRAVETLLRAHHGLEPWPSGEHYRYKTAE